MKKIILCSIFIVYVQSIFAQITGRIIDAYNQYPVIGANVFFNKTTKGTVTNRDGNFQLLLPEVGSFNLVVTAPGYETYTANIQSNKLPLKLDINLKPKTNESVEFSSEPYEKNGWVKWGRTFRESFLGSVEEAKRCKIVNPEVLKFRFNKNSRILKVTATAPLKIQNSALGYNIIFHLEEFILDFSVNYVLYLGYPFFEEIKSQPSNRSNTWAQNRAYAYDGSVMHFMRALYRNQLEEEGFELRKVTKIPNSNKEVKRATAQGFLIKNDFVVLQPSFAFYATPFLLEPDSLYIASNTLLNSKSIAFSVDSTTCGLYFDDYIEVNYTKRVEPIVYWQTIGTNFNSSINHPDEEKTLLSKIHITGDKPILIFSNGIYLDQRDFVYSGFWANYEVISRMLPYDYKRKK